MSGINPYHQAGLARNPFLVESEIEIPERLWLNRGFPSVPQPGGHQLIQVIGPPGAGKTSLLTHWRQTEPGPYHHYPPGIRRFRFPPLAEIAYWDEADRIPVPILNLTLKRAAKRATTLVCGTHRDLSGNARRYGFEVITIEPPRISPDELIAWASFRIRAVQIDSDQKLPIELTKQHASSITAEAGKSWRTAADLLHIWAAKQVNQSSFDATE